MPPPNSVGSRFPFPFQGPVVDELFRRPSPFPPNDFQGHSILVVYNPRARQGAYAREAQSLRSALESMGFEVHFLETVADAGERLRLIRNTSAPLLERNHGRGLHILPVGGDGTADQVIREVAQNITGPLHDIAPGSEANEALRRRLASTIILRTGTASDIANQLDAPPHYLGLRSRWNALLRRPAPAVFGEVPDFLSRTQVIPMGIASIRSPQGGDSSVFHSVDFGTGGYVFELGERNRQANPDSVWNRGIFNYLRVTPQAIREYGMKGFEVEINHHGRTERFRVGDVLGSTSRTIAGVGGIPGRWGEFKILAVPNGPMGVVTMFEALIRGLPTIYMGGNMVDADSEFWTLRRERQITLRPGERATLRFFDPVTREAIQVPWQANGDAIPKHVHEAEVYVPPLTIPVRSAPGSLGMRLFQQDELRRGLATGDPEIGRDLPISRWVSPADFYRTFWGGTAAVSGFYPASDLRSLATSLDLEPARIPLLVAHAHGVTHRDAMENIKNNALSMERLERWAQSEEGAAYIQGNRALWGDTFRNRLETHGVGLAMGAATMYFSNRLAKGVGIDPQRDPFLHFTATALASHGMNQVGNAAAGVLINRWRGIPYDVAMVETRSAQGLLASRMIYESHPNLVQAMRTATLRSVGFQGGPRSILARGVKSVFTVPGRMAMGMGLGLASSRLTAIALENTQMNEERRYHLASAAFFAPNVYHLAAGNRGMAMLESSSFRRVNAVFSAGFIADLAFTGIHSLVYGNQAPELRWRNHMLSAARERRENRGHFSMQGLFTLLSPELAAWWDAN